MEAKIDLQKNMEKFLHRKVVIRGDHPWAGYMGTTERVEMFNGVGPGMVVKLDNAGGRECTIFDAKNLIFIEF